MMYKRAFYNTYSVYFSIRNLNKKKVKNIYFLKNLTVEIPYLQAVIHFPIKMCIRMDICTCLCVYACICPRIYVFVCMQVYISMYVHLFN